MISKIKLYFNHPSKLGIACLKRCHFLPDKLYLKLRYRLEMGEKLNLKNPKTFQEKLQWLKLYDRNPVYTTMVDKYAVKKYVADRIGEQYIIPTLGVWKTFDEIDFNSLPERFVLKTTHGGGGGGVVICRDKSKFDKAEAARLIEHSMTHTIAVGYREWPYKNVPRRVIAESLIGKIGEDLFDYKFFCFNGVPRFFKVDFDRFIEHHANYYDMDWNLQEFGEVGLMPNPDKVLVKPDNFDEMIEVVKKLSEGHAFLRVDLYNVDGKVYFGELTFYPASGMLHFSPKIWDMNWGTLLTLPN